MDILKIVLLAAFACFFWLLLKGSQPGFALLVSLAACVALITLLISAAQPYFLWLREISSYFLQENFLCMFKCIGIALLAQICGAFCKDSGQEAIGATVELCGRILVILSALPMLQQVLSEILRLIS